MIKREIPGAGNLTQAQLKGISQTFGAVWEKIGSEIQWVHSYVTGDENYYVYTAPNEGMVREHDKQGGFPANVVNRAGTIIDPNTAN